VKFPPMYNILQIRYRTLQLFLEQKTVQSPTAVHATWTCIHHNNFWTIRLISWWLVGRPCYLWKSWHDVLPTFNNSSMVTAIFMLGTTLVLLIAGWVQWEILKNTFKAFLIELKIILWKCKIHILFLTLW